MNLNRANALENAFAMYDVRCAMYDLGNSRALRGNLANERAVMMFDAYR